MISEKVSKELICDANKAINKYVRGARFRAKAACSNKKHHARESWKLESTQQ